MSDWRDQAACLETDPELHFPIGNTGPAIPQAEAAKAVCAGCPVREECLRFALDTRQDHGIWGGLTEDERKTLQRRSARKARTAAVGKIVARASSSVPEQKPRITLGAYMPVEPVAAVIHLAFSAGWTAVEIGKALEMSDDNVRSIRRGAQQSVRLKTSQAAEALAERLAGKGARTR